ncbi:MAG: hypothetical protein HY548_05825 [Elusimicrobia bacterium]|nr:hypothetical protein [Elusimicrobiota bacterium]
MSIPYARSAENPPTVRWILSVVAHKPIDGGNGRTVLSPIVLFKPVPSPRGTFQGDWQGNKLDFKWSFPAGNGFYRTAGLNLNLFLADDSVYWYEQGRRMKEVEFHSSSLAPRIGLGWSNERGTRLETALGLAGTVNRRLDTTSPSFRLPSERWEIFLELRGRLDRGRTSDMGDQFTGFIAEAWLRGAHRDRWSPWGLPGRMEGTPGHRDFSHLGTQIQGGISPTGGQNIQIGVEMLGGHHLESLNGFSTGGSLESSTLRPLRGHYFREFRPKKLWMAHAAYRIQPSSRLRLMAFADYGVFNSFSSAGWPGLGLGLRLSTYKGIPVKILYGFAPRALRPNSRPGQEITVMTGIAFY